MSRSDFVRGELSEVSDSQAIFALNNRWALASAADFSSDVDVLNYALTLEYLESAFYQQGNAAGLVSGDEAALLAKIQADEDYHVTFLTAAIKSVGGTPVAAPTVMFGNAFDSRASYLTTSHTFENVGVGAYLGAAGYIKDKTILQAAAGIFGVEARHAAVVGNLLGLAAEGGVYNGAFEKPLTKAQVLAAAGPFLAPTGPANTGGGSAAEKDNTGLYALGGAALLGAAGAAVYAGRHRSADESGDATG